MPALPEAPGEALSLPVKDMLLKPLGSLIFRARLVGVAIASERQARQEMWGPDEAAYAARREELFTHGRIALVESTLNSELGTEPFLDSLRQEIDD